MPKRCGRVGAARANESGRPRISPERSSKEMCHGRHDSQVSTEERDAEISDVVRTTNDDEDDDWKVGKWLRVAADHSE